MSEPATSSPVADVLTMELERGGPEQALARARVHDGFDVFGIPHGGYLAAIAARAILSVAEVPDLFTVTVHYMRKATVGPMDLAVTRVGGSRRLATWQATATQEDRTVLTALASVGDRTGLDGPTWTDVSAWDPSKSALSPPAGTDGLPFAPPRISERFGQRLAMDTTGFATGQKAERAMMRCTLDTNRVDQLDALVACDITPPAAWNVLGADGWVPTVELTAHVRARPSPGPLSVDVSTHHVSDGFLEEDALVRDATGCLVVQSRQLARWTGS